DPTNEDALAECRRHSGLPARAMIASPGDIQNAIRVYYGGGRQAAPAAPAPNEPQAPPPAPAPAEGTPVDPPPSSAPVAPTISPSPAGVTAPPSASPSPIAPPAVASADDDAPEVEVREVEIPRARGKSPRMVSLTLLDGTTISLP